MTMNANTRGSEAIVIGTGFGGLAAAIRMRARGHRVRVLEANEQAGGRASVFKQDGFSFDAGPTVITAPYLIDELFELAGKKTSDYVELMPVDPFYRVIFHDGTRFDYVGDEERILSQIEKISPVDVDGYRKLAREAEKIFDKGYTELADKPFDRVGDMMRIIPDMMKLKSYRTVYGLVSTMIKDDRLRQLFTFEPLLVGGNPFDTTSIYLLIHWLERKWGVWFPKGGTGALIAALVRLLGEMDVEIEYNTPVDEIVVEKGAVTGVRVTGGRFIASNLVVSNGEPTFTYKNLIAKEHRKKHSAFSLGLRRQSMSLFVSYFGTTKKYEDLAHHTIILGPRYKGLLDDIFKKRVLADDYSLYLHRPTASDPDLAPPGHDAFYVLSPVPNLKSGTDWANVVDGYHEKILAGLERDHMPGLRANIATKLSIDPRTFRDRLRSVDGAAFGIEPVLRQSAWFRYHNRSEDVDGLYFVGAGTHPGAGVPGVLSSAKVLEKVLPELPASERAPLPSMASRRAA